MNKKWWEWVMYLLLLGLIPTCFRMQKQERTDAWLACLAAILALTIWYYYFVKYRPFRIYRPAVEQLAGRASFYPAPDAAVHVVPMLKAFPGFDDMSVNVDSVWARRTARGEFYLGRYAAGGDGGINWGFFVLAVFAAKEPVRMAADVFGGKPYPPEDRREPVIDAGLLAALQGLRYDWFVRNELLLVDFETREIKRRDFLDSLQRVVDGVPELGHYFRTG